jgi:arylsulfatase A-like enzyme
MRPSLSPLFLLAAAALLTACGSEGSSDRPNVLMVVIDTARADRFGSYGHDGGLTPNIDELAQAGVVFEEASAHAPWTLPSTASLLTSLHPPEHGAGGFLDLSPMDSGGAPAISFRGLQDERETLAETLGAAGWRTGAVVNVDFLDKTFGLTQGVHDLDAQWYDSNNEVRSAKETTDLALNWIGEREDDPFFLLVHYFDAHAVYSPPDEFRERHAAPVDRNNSNFVFGTRAHMLMLRGGQLQLEAPTIERAFKLYEAELAYVDQQIGRLLDGLQTQGVAENTLVVLTADHGEEFLDHGGFEHGHTLYQELLHVPLILSFPGNLSSGTRYAQSVGLVDVAPTICDLLQVPVPGSFAGRSLAGALAGRDLAERPVLSHGNFWGQPLVSWRSGPWKLILTPGEPGQEKVELYNLDTDPLEKTNVAESEPTELKRLRAELDQVRSFHASELTGKAIELDAEGIQRLKDLGYMGDGGTEPEGEGE